MATIQDAIRHDNDVCVSAVFVFCLSHNVGSRQVFHARIHDAGLHVRALLHQHALGFPKPTLDPGRDRFGEVK